MATTDCYQLTSAEVNAKIALGWTNNSGPYPDHTTCGSSCSGGGGGFITPPVSCCATVPQTLYCTCGGLGTATLIYSSTGSPFDLETQRWFGRISLPGLCLGNELQITLICNTHGGPPTWNIGIYCGSVGDLVTSPAYTAVDIGDTCSPFNLVFTSPGVASGVCSPPCYTLIYNITS